jgi:hypothetical protein
MPKPVSYAWVYIYMYIYINICKQLHFETLLLNEKKGKG